MGNTLENTNFHGNPFSASIFNTEANGNKENTTLDKTTRKEQLQQALKEIRKYDMAAAGRGRKNAEYNNILNRGFLNQELVAEGPRRKENRLSLIH